MIRLSRAALVAAILLAPACAHYPHTPPLPRHEPAAGYRFRNLPAGERNSDSLMVVLTFSGGGTRAAALSYGVLRELGRARLDGGARSLLDEVDAISSVSGGSFTAAFFALHGEGGLDRFERDFLKWDAQGTLKRSVLLPTNLLRVASPLYSRIDLATATWDRRLFHGATFGDLAGRRPLVIVNASDMSLGDPFSFTQEQFDALCADLSEFRLARAVAASSAFPGLLSPISLENHGEGCGYAPPDWVSVALEPGNETVGGDRYRLARNVMSYRDTSSRPYVHLLDGGLADNIGLRPVLRSLTTTSGDWSILRMINNRQVRRVVVIVVNAKTHTESNVDLRERAPDLKRVLQTVVGTPMGNYSRESVQRLREVADDFARDYAAAGDGDGLPPLAFHAIEISFEGLQDASERHFFETLPTTFALPAATVDRLTEVGGRLLRDSPEYRALLIALRE